MTTTNSYSLFEVFGVELEYMIVDAQTLAVHAITDRVLHDVAGAFESEVEIDDIAWSNELALHVIELKTNGPTSDLAQLPARFQDHVDRINGLLQKHRARLMPTAMHPWMDPKLEMKLWPHEYNAVYEAFNRIFDCRGHGWANLQSVHLNLPFANDQQFGQLHAAIRLVLPLLPALAASSPIFSGQTTGVCDNRLDVYRQNAARIPSITGQVVPEQAFSRADYERIILEPMYRDIAVHDSQGVLRNEWLNSRGAIARFDRQTIEIRVLDIQECPLADLSICAATVGLLRALVQQAWSSHAEQQSIPAEPLAELLRRVIRDADEATIDDANYLRVFGVSSGPIKASELWRYLLAQTSHLQPGGADRWRDPLSVIQNEGPLARRIVRQLGESADLRSRQTVVYQKLCDCLRVGTMLSSQTSQVVRCDPGC